MPCMPGAQIATALPLPTAQPLPSADELIAQALAGANAPEEQVAALKTSLVELHFAYTVLRGVATEQGTPPCLKSTLRLLAQDVAQVAQTPGVTYVWMHSPTLQATALFGYELMGEEHIKTLTEVHLRGMNLTGLLCEAVMGQLERELLAQLDEMSMQGACELEAQP